ncbi:metacaspase-1 [Dipodascopsis tothii]|uniref:metacaspase-1 n=1 Tax=Dipodascopsis tothii TaxID=44089 RepID=UPI0034CEE7B1
MAYPGRQNNYYPQQGGFGGPPQGPPPGFGGPPQGPPPGFGDDQYGQRYGQQYGQQYDQRDQQYGQQYSPQYDQGQQFGGPPSGPPPGHHHRQHQQQYQRPQDDGYSPAQSVYGEAPPPTQYAPQTQSRPPYPLNQAEVAYAQQVGIHRDDSHPMAPPSGMQQFGQGAPNEYAFQYSTCQGRRKALLIGINYLGQKNELRGCINDVKNISAFLKNYGYKTEDMVILTDDQQNQRSIPTKDNILRAMSWLVKDAQPNDSLFIHYSGHGGVTEDLDGDEADGYDEVIYPVDFQTAGHIVDDQIHDVIVKPLPAGCRLTAIFDSCHSGSVLDLPYMYSTSGTLKEPNLAKEAGQGLLSALSSYSRGDLGSMVSAAKGVLKLATTGERANQLTRRTKTAPGDVVLFSGCKDTQTSADAVENGSASGAMSHAFVTVLSQYPEQSYQSLLQNLRAYMAPKYSQKCQLSCSHPLDTRLKFIL